MKGSKNLNILRTSLLEAPLSIGLSSPGRSCEYEPGQAQQGHIHRSKESDQILTGRESPLFSLPFSSSGGIGMLVTSLARLLQ